MSDCPSFLLALQLSGKPCLVIGSGSEAARRARDLATAGALVTVVALTPCPELEHLAAGESIALERRDLDLADLDGRWLVVLADRDPTLLEQVGPRCSALRIFFCAVDQPGHSSFHHVALARSGRLSVAVSTDGAAPALAKRFRDELERALGQADAASFTEHLAELRARTQPKTRGREHGAEAARPEPPALIAPPRPPRCSSAVATAKACPSR